MFNRRPYLRHAVVSALTQGLSDVEVIVVDDGSTDGSLETLSDLPVRGLRTPRRGMAAARNLGLAQATGRYVTFLDSDDLLAPQSLSWRRQWLQAHPEEPWVAGTVRNFIGPTGEPVTAPNYHPGPPPPRLDLTYFRSGGRLLCAGWSVMGRREHLPLFDESLRIVPDTEYLLRLCRIRPIPVIDAPVIHYRLHPGNVSNHWDGTGYRPTRGVLAESCLINWEYAIPPSRGKVP